MNELNLDLNINEILQDWEQYHAIRELLANAIDEHNIQGIKKDIYLEYDRNTKELIIKDFGRGIKTDNFIQNENKEKINNPNIIGKFGIGLKDAIAVLNRKKINIEIISKFGKWIPIKESKDGTDIPVIKMNQSNTNDLNKIGTEIILNGIDEEDLLIAKKQFIIWNNLKKVDDNEYGEVYETPKNEKSSIFLNGMKISEEEKFKYTYNILKPNNKLLKNLNRERRSIGRDSYRDSIISIIKNSEENILKNIRDSKNDEYSFIDVKIKIFEVLNILPTDQKTIDENPIFIHYAKHENREYEVVNEKEYKSFENYGLETLKEFGKKIISNYEPIEIDENLLNKDKKEIFNISKEFVNKYGLNKRNFKIILIKEHPNASGICIHNKKEIQLVENKVLLNIETCLSTLLHELAHSYNEYKDGTPEFEKELSDIGAQISKILINKY